MVLRVNKVAYPRGLGVADTGKLGSLGRELGDLLVVLRLLREKLRSVALGLLDLANLLLERVDGAALVLHLILGCSHKSASGVIGQRSER